MRVLLVEDDPMIGQSIFLALKDDGYAADWVKEGDAALTTLSCQSYDLILLDLGLPKKNGFEVLSHLRSEQQTTPVLIITAKDAVEDRIAGLDLGADDYVLKPFNMAELLARMRAVLRRKGGSGAPIFSNGILSLDPVTHSVHHTIEGAEVRSVDLSNREFTLLQALLIRPGAILSREVLENKLYGWGEEVESNAVEFLIHGLRKKLGKDSIKNVRGVGWMVAKEK